MKVRLKAKTLKGKVALQDFMKEANKPLSLKEKLQVVAVDPFGFGRIKVKVFSDPPFVLVVTNSKWKKYSKIDMDVTAFYPVITDKWLPSVVAKVDYEVRLV